MGIYKHEDFFFNFGKLRFSNVSNEYKTHFLSILVRYSKIPLTNRNRFTMSTSAGKFDQVETSRTTNYQLIAFPQSSNKPSGALGHITLTRAGFQTVPLAAPGHNDELHLQRLGTPKVVFPHIQFLTASQFPTRNIQASSQSAKRRPKKTLAQTEPHLFFGYGGSASSTNPFNI